MSEKLLYPVRGVDVMHKALLSEPVRDALEQALIKESAGEYIARLKVLRILAWGPEAGAEIDAEIARVQAIIDGAG